MALDDYRAFRHVVRNVYAFNFDPDRVEQLVIKLRPLLEQVEQEVRTFADFLETVAKD